MPEHNPQMVKFVKVPASLLMRLYEITEHNQYSWPVSPAYLQAHIDDEIEINARHLSILARSARLYIEPEVADYLVGEVDRLLEGAK